MDMNALSEPCLVAMMEQNNDDESVPDECMNEADLAVLMAGGGGAPNMEDLSEACLVAFMEQHNDDEEGGGIPAECMNEADIALFTSWGENSSPTMDQLAQLSEECFAALMAQHDDDDHEAYGCTSADDCAGCHFDGDGNEIAEGACEFNGGECFLKTGENHCQADEHGEYVQKPPPPFFSPLSPSASPTITQRRAARLLAGVPLHDRRDHARHHGRSRARGPVQPLTDSDRVRHLP
jgi:hypothetical protein